MNDGATPLYVACHNGHVKVVKTLLTNKEIDINKDWEGKTPLACAIEEDLTEIVALLQQHGAK
jgi:ankyrin repeat protein